MENNNPQPLSIINTLFSGRLWAGNRSVIPLGYVSIFILFAFSFCDFKCNVDHLGASTGSVTGYELVIGKYVEANPLLKKGAEEKEFRELLNPIYKTYKDKKGTRVEAMRIPSNTFAIISLITAALGLLLFMFVYENNKGYVAIASGLTGTISMLLLNSSLSNMVSEKFSYILKADFTMAYWLATATFGIIAIAGYYRLKYTETAVGEENGKVIYAPVKVISMEDLLRNNKWGIIAVVMLLGSSILFYKLYFSNNYDSEIKELAIKGCECEKEKVEKMDKHVKAYMVKLNSSTADDISKLRNDFNTGYNRIVKDYGRCNNSLKRKYEELSTKAIGSKGIANEDEFQYKYEGYFEEFRDSLVDEDKYLNSDDFYRSLDSLSNSGNGLLFEPPIFNPE
ncbi:MAG: hypothetical protein M0D57_02790 [Sphingobacteriales bacterium JAD_PAG50586_3]|nr:MAG: hypothetical protein M0D57_02790 [Sphingobacteriales bacterium JAD_PAG50586_3]